MQLAAELRLITLQATEKSAGQGRAPERALDGQERANHGLTFLPSTSPKSPRATAFGDGLGTGKTAGDLRCFQAAGIGDALVDDRGSSPCDSSRPLANNSVVGPSDKDTQNVEPAPTTDLLAIRAPSNSAAQAALAKPRLVPGRPSVTLRWNASKIHVRFGLLSSTLLQTLRHRVGKSLHHGRGFGASRIHLVSDDGDIDTDATFAAIPVDYIKIVRDRDRRLLAEACAYET